MDEIRNRPSYQRHRRQFFWQILLPVLLTVLFAVGIGVLAVAGTSVRASLWADAALIWVLSPLLILTLIPLALVIAAVVGMTYLLQKMPSWAARAQFLAHRMAAETERAGSKLAEPMIRVRSWQAALERLVQGKKKE